MGVEYRSCNRRVRYVMNDTIVFHLALRNWRSNVYDIKPASGCVVECRICNWEVACSNLGRGYFAPRSTQPFIPPGVGKWVPPVAGKAKTGMAHSNGGQSCGCAGKTVRSPVNTCHTWALVRWWFTTIHCAYIKCMYLYLNQNQSNSDEEFRQIIITLCCV